MTIDRKCLINWVGGKRLLRKTIEKLLRNMVIKEWPVKFDYDVIWRAILSDVADNDNT